MGIHQITIQEPQDIRHNPKYATNTHQHTFIHETNRVSPPPQQTNKKTCKKQQHQQQERKQTNETNHKQNKKEAPAADCG